MNRITTARRALRTLSVAIGGTTALALIPSAASAAGQTCTPRTPQTYQAGLAVSTPTSPVAGAPTLTPCINYTGFGGAEAVIRTTPDGKLFYSTAFTKEGVGILRSGDQGNTWEYRNTTVGNDRRRSRVEPFMDRDDTTGRLFLNTSRLDIRGGNLTAFGFDTTYSDDDGQTWKYSRIPIRAIDMIRMAAGKPVTSTLKGYPNILYAMAPGPISTPVGLNGQLAVQKPLQQVVLKSLDGGVTWGLAGAFSIRPQDNGCPESEWVLWSAIRVASDGTLYVAGRRCRSVGLAVSHDEGKTWTIKNVPKTYVKAFQTILDPVTNPNYVIGDPLQIDRDGNMYLAYADSIDRTRLTVSRDGGATWSTPVVISAPGVNHTYYPSIAVSEPGHVGIGYLGVAGGSNADGYMAESTNALDPNPRFTSQMINDPATPLHPKGVQSGYIMMFVADDLNEWIHVRFGANGDLFGAFTADMCPNGGVQIACLPGWDYWGATDRSRWQAVVGRLAHS